MSEGYLWTERVLTDRSPRTIIDTLAVPFRYKPASNCGLVYIEDQLQLMLCQLNQDVAETLYRNPENNMPPRRLARVVLCPRSFYAIPILLVVGDIFECSPEIRQ